MGRALALALTIGLLGPAGTAAQQVRVRLEVTASESITATGTRRPMVRTPNILRDQRWREAITNSFPLRLRFRVEIWRIRTDWFDALEQSFEWEILVQYEPLTDEYSKTLIFRGSPRGLNRFLTLQELERDLETPNAVGIVPPGPGEYYFTGSLQIRTLTDDEMEELERFLQGNPARESVEREATLGRALRRLIVRFGGLPYQELEAKSDRFTIRAPEH